MRSLIRPVLIALSFLFCFPLIAQRQVDLLSKWDYRRKTKTHEKIKKAITTSSGLIVAVGETMGASFQDFDGLFLVIDAEDGSEIQRKSFGGSGDDTFNAVVQNHDGTFTIVGSTKAGRKSDQNGWVVRLDQEGNLLFEDKPASQDKRDDDIIDVAISPSGKVRAIGSQRSKKANGLWLLSIEAKKVTSRIISNGAFGSIEEMVATPDNGFVLVGSTGIQNKEHPEDAWILKINDKGQDQWGGVKYFGDRNMQTGQDITNTIDGGYAIVGTTNSKGAGLEDKWLIKLNKNGDKEWDRTYGKKSDDIATSLIELSDGGFAIFGQTKSYMPRATTSMLELLVTDEKGNELESNTYPIYEEPGNEIAQSLLELFSGDIVIIGHSNSLKDEHATPHIGAITYKTIERQPNSIKAQEDNFGNFANIQDALVLSEPTFFDHNGNQFLESGERGYFALEIRNQGKDDLRNISSLISPNGEAFDIDFWKKIKIGTLRAGQSKRIVVPVHAKKAPSKGSYQLTANIEVSGNHAASAIMSLKSNEPDPARLAINNSSFVPGANPRPGTPIQLTVELVNTGQQAARALLADFEIPPGVKSTDSERRRIPSLRPRETYNVVFSFTYESNYRGETIPITFKTQGEGINPIKKTFHLQVNNAAPPEPIVAGTIPDEMVWASPDPSEYQSRTVPVNKKEVDVKVIALSKKQLNKTKFKVLINGKRNQGQKMDEAKLGPPTVDAGRNRQSYSHKVRLLPGNNTVQIIYENEDGSEFKSPPITFEYQPRSNPNLYVYSIGVSHDDLKYTTKDAEDIARRIPKTCMMKKEEASGKSTSSNSPKRKKRPSSKLGKHLLRLPGKIK